MLWSVIGDLTERLAQHDECDHYVAKKKSYLRLSKQLQNWSHQNKLHVPLATPATHRQTQSGAWLQFWRASHFSSVSLFQGFWYWNSYWALVWYKQTGTNIPPDRFQQHLRSEQLADLRTLQQRKTRHSPHQTIVQKCLEHPFGDHDNIIRPF